MDQHFVLDVREESGEIKYYAIEAFIYELGSVLDRKERELLKAIEICCIW
jgi:hypothetical protein